jgi:hypothetical protein
LYSLGGFTLPFISVGSVTLLVAIFLLIIVPNVTTEAKDKTDGGKSLTFAGLIKVNLSGTIMFQNHNFLFEFRVQII